jgi:V8-like Glu-specific endopeptidase
MRERSGFLFWLIIILALVFVSRVRAYPPEFQSVCVIQEQTGNYMGWGTGTVVATNDKIDLILTVRHVVKGPGHLDLFIWPNAGKAITSGITLENLEDAKSSWWESSDAALAICHKPETGNGNYIDITPAKIASFDPKAGPWYGVGYVSGRLTVVKAEHCVATDSVLLFDCLFIPGQSGGPVFDRRGKVVGVISSYNTKMGLSCAVDGDNLKKILALYGVRVD